MCSRDVSHSGLLNHTIHDFTHYVTKLRSEIMLLVRGHMSKVKAIVSHGEIKWDITDKYTYKSHIILVFPRLGPVKKPLLVF